MRFKQYRQQTCNYKLSRSIGFLFLIDRLKTIGAGTFADSWEDQGSDSSSSALTCGCYILIMVSQYLNRLSWDLIYWSTWHEHIWCSSPTHLNLTLQDPSVNSAVVYNPAVCNFLETANPSVSSNPCIPSVLSVLLITWATVSFNRRLRERGRRLSQRCPCGDVRYPIGLGQLPSVCFFHQCVVHLSDQTDCSAAPFDRGRL